MKVGIVGTGLIGTGWAAFYASRGFAVSLFDSDEATRNTARDRTVAQLRFMNTHGLLGSHDFNHVVEQVTVADDLTEAVVDANLVQESVVERYDVKKEVFRAVDRATSPDTILASSSSGLLISELQLVMEHPGRSLIAHPFNPPHLMPLVELVPGKLTRPEVVAEVKTLFESLGKVPVVLHKEIPGHIANRLQAAVWREAIDLVLNGVASVADVDKALVAGPGMRWALMGAHMIFHLGGGSGGIEYFVNHVGRSFDAVWNDMASWNTLPPKTAEALREGLQAEIGDRPLEDLARWRDEKLVQLLKIARDQQEPTEC
jgi:3-hydroxyacyl-CoA dehydrogenase